MKKYKYGTMTMDSHVFSDNGALFTHASSNMKKELSGESPGEVKLYKLQHSEQAKPMLLKSATEDIFFKQKRMGAFGDYVRREPGIDMERANGTSRGAHQGQ